MLKYLCIFYLFLCLGGVCADKPVFETKLTRAGDRSEVVVAEETAIFTVASGSGIGGATITLKKGAWPKQVVFRLRYRDGRGFPALEGFTLATPRLFADGSWKETGKLPFRFTDDKGAVDLKAPHAGTLDITMTPGDAYLEIILPAYLLTGSRECEVQWVDFYRG